MGFQLTAVQAQAIEPQHSIWLTAHAGTGKTKVLVDRMLRLLTEGEQASGILALTYTKAAAAEMQERLHREVRRLCQLDESALQAALLQLGCDISSASLARARQLFLQVIDADQPLQILTIHSFCQSLLARFPLEADLPLHVSAIEDAQVVALLQEAKYAVFDGAISLHSGDEALAASAELLAVSMADQTLDGLLGSLIEKRFTLLEVYSDPQLRSTFLAQLKAALPDCDLTQEALLAERTLNESQQEAIYSALLSGSSEDQDKAASLKRWLDSGDIEHYLAVFLTGKYAPRARLMTSKIAAQFPELHEAMQREQQWALRFHDARVNRETYLLSLASARLAEALFAQYERLKAQRGFVDYHDLISAALRLLSKPGVCEWVMTKLDRRLNHILLDEAQDTNPQLWRLLARLVEELYQPDLYDRAARTLFVVGDRKQSIYRFQGADPRGFIEKADSYRQHFVQTGQSFAALTLARSFRSGRAVLALVDAVCAQPLVKSAIAEDEVRHELHRSDAAGCVRLWPLLTAQKDSAPDAPPWERLGQPPAQAAGDVMQQLAEKIAIDAAQRIASGQNRAGDIMVLVRRRKPLIERITREMQMRGVPVAGADRLSLLEHWAISEVLAVMRFCLLSADELSLAEVLKGALFMLSDDALDKLARARRHSGQNLWQHLQQAGEDDAGMVQMLLRLQRGARELRPYEWCCLLLDECAMAKALKVLHGDEAMDALEMIKEMALQFEAQHPPHLQLFMHWFEQNAGEVKRDLQLGSGGVRIMTVHGAKGLQAPLVYLPDTVRVPKSHEKMIWREPAQEGELPLAFVPPGGHSSAALNELKRQQSEHDMQEYWRLLYVALTRAEDELVICGYRGQKDSAQTSWYDVLQQVLSSLGAQQDEHGQLVFSGGSKARQSANIPDIPEAAPQHDVPAWLSKAHPLALRRFDDPVLSPSLLGQLMGQGDSLQMANASSIDSAEGNEEARTYGTLLHALLQIMPSGSTDKATIAALMPRVLQSCGFALASSAQEAQIAIDAARIMKQYPEFFGVNSRAEVWLQGSVTWRGENVMLRGQIDRLIETDSEWLIIDYKSSAQVPAEMPEAYLLQLAAYRAMLLPIAGAKPVRCGLLWTQDASLMMADEAAMDALCKPAAADLDSAASEAYL